jgi:[ribosomal protein S18]-alanine N-acetyltransferase
VSAPYAIREAALADLDQLVDIENESFDSDRLSRANLRYALNSPAQSVLAIASGRNILGDAIIEFRKSSKSARLASIAIRKSAAGQGLGRLLMQGCEDHARRRGCNRFRLEVRADNQAAISLYEKLGYRQFDVLKDYYEDGASALRFEKSL